MAVNILIGIQKSNRGNLATQDAAFGTGNLNLGHTLLRVMHISWEDLEQLYLTILKHLAILQLDWGHASQD